MVGLKRIELIKEDPFYLECLSLNGDRERDRLFCRHDYKHMLLVSQISCKIINEISSLDGLAREVNGGAMEALEVIYAAGLLHDIGRWRQYDTGVDHALVGSGMAVPLLERAGFAKREIEIVTRAIREHRKAGPGSSYLGRVICLADDLSRSCNSCGARFECYKYDYMETIRERNLKGFVLNAI
ncbi:MAG: HD domain-containing protein [Bacillota bacterium]